MRNKYKKLLKVQKHVFLWKSAEEYSIDFDDSAEKHAFDAYVWLDLLAEKIVFNFFSSQKRKYKLKGVLKFNMEQKASFNQLKDYARALARAHLQKLAIENSTIVFDTGN